MDRHLWNVYWINRGSVVAADTFIEIAWRLRIYLFRRVGTNYLHFVTRSFIIKSFLLSYSLCLFLTLNRIHCYLYLSLGRSKSIQISFKIDLTTYNTLVFSVHITSIDQVSIKFLNIILGDLDGFCHAAVPIQSQSASSRSISCQGSISRYS
jgi:hypothetical protein